MPMEGDGIHDVWDVLFISSLCVMCVLCVAGNVTVILTIFGTPKLRSGSSLLLFNLGVCDLLNGTIRISVVTDSFLRGSRLDQISCSITANMTCLFAVVSIVTITFIALDRYLSIIHCLRYSSWSPMRTTSSAIIISWVIGLSSSIPSISSHWGRVTYDPKMFMCYVTWNSSLSYSIFQFSVTYMIPILTMVYAYIRIIAVARAHAKKINDLNVNRSSAGSTIPPHGLVAFAVVDPVRQLPVMGFSGAPKSLVDFDLHSFTGNGQSNSSSERHSCKQKAMLRLVGHIVAFMICWTPFIVYEFKYLSKNSQVEFSDISLRITTWLLCLHSAWNPFLYAILNGRFRKCALKLAKTQRTSVTCVRDLNRSKIISSLSQRRPHVTVEQGDTKSSKSDTTHLTVSDHHVMPRTQNVDVPIPHVVHFCPYPETNFYHQANGLHKENMYATKRSLPCVLETLPSVESVDEGVFLDDEIVTKRNSQ
ncbi:5-hydroxytryptamine receptor 1D-like [Crassostrea virginica]|uniref:5-hydroxytryptamine receptor 1D-like n=1 Tax=Crassostrea virginica TaxID=6565 RepID=A0A8B8CZN0_CRAVI|nr:5-hydroxytryptamine receptor 1D-like [Crassostrea virginica]